MACWLTPGGADPAGIAVFFSMSLDDGSYHMDRYTPEGELQSVTQIDPGQVNIPPELRFAPTTQQFRSFSHSGLIALLEVVPQDVEP